MSTYEPHTAEIISDNNSFVLKFWPNSNTAELIIKDGVVYDLPEAKMTKKYLEELDPASKYYLLVSSHGFFRATKRTRKLGATKTFSSHLAAVAFFTNNSSLALLGELYNKINKPAVPTKVFYDRNSAIDWLAEQKQNGLLAQSFHIGANDGFENLLPQNQSV